MGSKVEEGVIGEAIDPQVTYSRLQAACALLPVVKEAPTKYDFEERRRDFPDGASLKIRSNASDHRLEVRVNYGARSDINFELSPEQLKRLRFNKLSLKFGDAELQEESIVLVGQEATLKTPKYQKIARKLVGWVEQLANSPTFIQPPITVTLVK
ncbi:hypothetical protein HYW66_02170 [Candidatus Microgenomates bacterium]|nr:hypothetical protein [Candidatus Microgenomates bacterium]